MPTLASLLLVLAGVTASAALAIDYSRPTPVFCSEGGGCEALRRTAFAAVLGVPTPLVGLGGFLSLGIASLWPGRRARVAEVVLASLGALVAAVLLAAQWAIGHACPYCCVVDASAIASAMVAWWRLLRAPDAAPQPSLVYAGASALVLAAAAPVGAGWLLGRRAPRAIRAEMAASRPGDVTVVDFVDFECPFCRMTNAELEPILEAHRDRVRVVRRQVPLSMHPHALDAARAACCSERLGRGEAMTHALFAAPVDELTREGCEDLAKSVGLALDSYRACVADPSIDRRIESDRAVFRAAGGYALPTLWVDGFELVGAQSRVTLEKAIVEAISRAGG